MKSLARIALDCSLCGLSPRSGRQRWRVRGSDGGVCRAATSGVAASCAAACTARRLTGFEPGPGVGHGDGERGQHARLERRLTRMQGRKLPSCTVCVRVPSKAGLFCVSRTNQTGPPGQLGTAAHPDSDWHCINLAQATIGPCRAHLEPRMHRLKSGKSSTCSINGGPTHYRGQGSASAARRHFAGCRRHAAGRGGHSSRELGHARAPGAAPAR